MRSPPRFFVQIFVRVAQVILLRYYQAARAEKCMEGRGVEHINTPRIHKALGAAGKSAFPAPIFRAGFWAGGAGNTLAVLSSRPRRKMHGKARRGACFCPPRRVQTKKQTEFSLLFEIYTKQKGGSGSYGNGF